MMSKPVSIYHCVYCDEEVNQDLAKNHLEICKLKPIDCNNGCGLKFYIHQLDKHKSKCTHRMLICKNCNKDFKANVLIRHRKNCPKVLIGCPHNCGCVRFPRDELENHIKESCQALVILCNYTYAGCQYKGNENSLKRHNEECSSHHLRLVESSFNQQLIQSKALEVKPKQLTAEEAKAAKLIENLTETIGKLTETVEQLKQIMLQVINYNYKFVSKEEKKQPKPPVEKLTENVEKPLSNKEKKRRNRHNGGN